MEMLVFQQLSFNLFFNVIPDNLASGQIVKIEKTIELDETQNNELDLILKYHPLSLSSQTGLASRTSPRWSSSRRA